MVAGEYEEAYRELEGILGERMRREDPTGSGASVSAANADEVALVAEIAERHGLPLSLRGAGTVFGPSEPDAGLSLRFEQMKSFAVRRGGGDALVELEPGIPWVELEDHLHAEGESLRVYPTSAPRSTVGGWLARDGLGVGSYEYGWLSENVDSVEVVLPGGQKRVVEGRDLSLVVGAEGATGIIVGATLRLRGAGHDQPFAAAFDDPAGLPRAIEGLAAERLPLWHLGLAHPALALSESSETGYVLFGTHAGERGSRVEAALGQTISEQGGRMLSSAEAYRSWGARFFPAGLTGDLPTPATAVVPVTGLEEALSRLGQEVQHLAVQGSVARGGEALLISFRIGDSGRLETPDEADREALLRIAQEAGGGEYLVGLRRFEGDPRREELLQLKKEVDPKGILEVPR
jgi:glycolate oxidase